MVKMRMALIVGLAALAIGGAGTAAFIFGSSEPVQGNVGFDADSGSYDTGILRPIGLPESVTYVADSARASTVADGGYETVADLNLGADSPIPETDQSAFFVKASFSYDPQKASAWIERNCHTFSWLYASLVPADASAFAKNFASAEAAAYLVYTGTEVAPAYGSGVAIAPLGTLTDGDRTGLGFGEAFYEGTDLAQFFQLGISADQKFDLIFALPVGEEFNLEEVKTMDFSIGLNVREVKYE